MDRFKDKVVIVTGAASGIGEATTRRIVSEGGTVVLADFAKEKMTLLTQELKNEKAGHQLFRSGFSYQSTLCNLFKPARPPGNDPAKRRKYREYSFYRRHHRRFQRHVLRSCQSRNHQLNPLHGHPNGKTQHPL